MPTPIEQQRLLLGELLKRAAWSEGPFDSNSLFVAMRLATQLWHGRYKCNRTFGSRYCHLGPQVQAPHQPLARLLAPIREAVPVYGSGGFTTYTDSQIRKQLSDWISQGIPRVKIRLNAP